MEEKFNESIENQLLEKGIDKNTLEKQLRFFKNGIAKIKLVKSAKIKDGIHVFNDEKLANYVTFFENELPKYKVEKFVPASGAASRMFKFLSEFLNDFDSTKETLNSYINHRNDSELAVFIVGVKNLPFYKQVKEKTISLYPDFYTFENDIRNYLIVKTLLAKEHFDFANKPKGILPFHQYDTQIITPIEEHLKEATFYKTATSNPKVHFTVSPEHLDDFEKITNGFKDTICSFSFQDPKTDTLAVTIDNEPFVTENGSLLFRPGGHGALITNLSQLDSDIIFIKNIDNVSLINQNITIQYKKLLGGILMQYQQQIFAFITDLNAEKVTTAKLKEIKKFAKKKLQIVLPKDFEMYKKTFQIQVLIQQLNRPIRVCGMVKNEGEPGGGPFWVQEENGSVSLQIVETSQIDIENGNQLQILKDATHFNPVDLVCGIKDFKGNKFDLSQYVNENTGFIVQKTKDGKPYKAFELPGLWNGAMANWISIFVEVPLITFNPVKTVNDLLKPAHQPEQNG